MGPPPRTVRALVAALLLLGSTPALADAQRVENFGLLDHQGRFRELYRDANGPAIVLFVQGNGCPIVRKNVPALESVRKQFAPLGVEFWMINASPQDDLDEIAAEAEAWRIDFPILKDDARLVARALGLERTAEALVIDPKTWAIVYRGPLDDRLGYETERPVRERYLEAALTRFLAGEPIATPVRAPQGCLIHLEGEPGGKPPGGSHDPAHPHGDHGDHGNHGDGHGGASGIGGPHGDGDAPPAYARDVAPILAERCRSCHREGGIAPWSMTDWATVRGWAPMMREVLRTGRMPPWRPDPRYGRFANDLALPSHERATLVRWIEAGAPRGGGPDPLVEHPAAAEPEWPLGEPDLLLAAPEQQIPASGILPYRYEVIEVGADRELWVRATHLQPSTPGVMHHAIAWIRYPKGFRRPRVEGPRFSRGQFSTYVPGRRVAGFPEGTAFLIPKGSTIRIQIHYQATGRAEVDTPRLALYLADGPAAHELRMGAVADASFVIPPHVAAHEVVARIDVSRDILVYNLSPHMHFRGRSMRFDLHYPDGRSETLLSVPRYDFNWQHTYELAEPLAVPAGSRLEVTAVFDNSEHNPANPDPDAWVRWGKQSSDEMMFGHFLYRERGKTESAERWRRAAGERQAHAGAIESQAHAAAPDDARRPHARTN